MAGTGRFVVGGNWKCNGNTASIAKLVKELNAGEITADVEVICAPPMVYLPKVQSTLDRKYQLAAQNCWVGAGGAFTGEVAAEMLVDAGVPWVILGHSERRALCGESDEFVGKKTKYAIDKGLSVMACIGETLDEREAGATLDVCRRQLQAVANEISADDWAKVVIAHEPCVGHRHGEGGDPGAGAGGARGHPRVRRERRVAGGGVCGSHPVRGFGERGELRGAGETGGHRRVFGRRRVARRPRLRHHLQRRAVQRVNGDRRVV